MSGMTQANSRYVKKRWKKRGKSIMKLLKFELFGMQKACQSKSQLKDWHSRGVWPNLQHNLEC